MSINPNSYLAKEMLAINIIKEFEEEFKDYFVSRNLVNTINLEITGDGINVVIPAEVYDMNFWKKYGVIVYNKPGESYATEVDEKGGFSHRHTNFVEKCINKGIENWLNSLALKGETK